MNRPNPHVPTVSQAKLVHLVRMFCTDYCVYLYEPQKTPVRVCMYDSTREREREEWDDGGGGKAQIVRRTGITYVRVVPTYRKAFQDIPCCIWRAFVPLLCLSEQERKRER